MKTAALNFWLDVAIGIAFVASAATGIVFLLPLDGGDGVLGLAWRRWSDLHTWSSLAVVGGVVAHVALHWRWVLAVARKQLAPVRHPRPAPTGMPVPATPEVRGGTARGMTRRSFLALGGTAGFATGLGAVGLLARLRVAREAGAGALTDADRTFGADGASPEDVQMVWSNVPATATEAPPEATARPTITIEPAEGGVACRHGVVNDRYPGECRHYVDRDGDGICDLSVPGSGSNVARG